MAGSNVPFTPSVMPVPVHAPPPVAALRLNEAALTQIVEGCVMVASGGTVIVMVVESVFPQLPPTVLITVYVPAVLAERSTRPVEALMLNPAVELNVPAVPPAANTGEGSVPFWQ